MFFNILLLRHYSEISSCNMSVQLISCDFSFVVITSLRFSSNVFCPYSHSPLPYPPNLVSSLFLNTSSLIFIAHIFSDMWPPIQCGQSTRIINSAMSCGYPWETSSFLKGNRNKSGGKEKWSKELEGIYRGKIKLGYNA